MPQTSRPRVHDLIPDPFRLSRVRRAIVLGRPLVAFGLFVAFAANGWWMMAIAAQAAGFVAASCVMHDAIHRSLGLGEHRHAIVASVSGLLILNAGTALTITHLRHHRSYPSGSDPETYLEPLPWWRAVLECPCFRFRLWRWAWRHRGLQGRRIVLEIAVCAAAWAAAAAGHDRWPALTLYVVIAEIGTCLFPAIAVFAVHDRRGGDYLSHMRTTRIRALDPFTLGMQYHLEHHLYPRVPTARLAALAKALDPWLAANGVAVAGKAAVSPPRGRRARGAAAR